MTLVSAGRFKTEGSPFEELGDEARKEMQRQVDRHYGQFIDDLAMGRMINPAKVERDFGQGRMVPAADAVRLGMADRVATVEQAMQGIAVAEGRVPRRDGPPPPDRGVPAVSVGSAPRRGLDSGETGALCLPARPGRPASFGAGCRALDSNLRRGALPLIGELGRGVVPPAHGTGLPVLLRRPHAARRATMTGESVRPRVSHR